MLSQLKYPKSVDLQALSMTPKCSPEGGCKCGCKSRQTTRQAWRGVRRPRIPRRTLGCGRREQHRASRARAIPDRVASTSSGSRAGGRWFLAQCVAGHWLGCHDDLLCVNPSVLGVDRAAAARSRIGLFPRCDEFASASGPAAPSAAVALDQAGGGCCVGDERSPLRTLCAAARAVRVQRPADALPAARSGALGGRSDHTAWTGTHKARRGRA